MWAKSWGAFLARRPREDGSVVNLDQKLRLRILERLSALLAVRFVSLRPNLSHSKRLDHYADRLSTVA
jgi:hypothetical protein